MKCEERMHSTCLIYNSGAPVYSILFRENPELKFEDAFGLSGQEYLTLAAWNSRCCWANV
jgi:hypothetical protein